jgi:hypothetical protein
MAKETRSEIDAKRITLGPAAASGRDATII